MINNVGIVQNSNKLRKYEKIGKEIEVKEALKGFAVLAMKK